MSLLTNQKFNVYGMTCGACAVRVEKSVGALPGMRRATVNLLQHTLTAEFDPGQTSAEAVAQAVERAGYRAEAAGAGVSTPKLHATGDESAALKRRFWTSFWFLLPLFYVAMGPMFSWPVPAFFEGKEYAAGYALTQLLLLAPIVVVNLSYFTRGFVQLWRRSPNMDSLIAVGCTAAALYGVFELYRLLYGLDPAYAAHGLDLYFESAGMILTLITLGKYLESRAKGKASDAVTRLLDLSPKKALVLRGGKEWEIPAAQVLAGDLVIVKQGAGVPADGTIVEGYGSLDESALTGESLPVDKKTGDRVAGATINRAGYFVFKAEKVGADTALAQIIKLVEDANSTKAPIAKLADRVSGVFVPVVMGIALVTFVVWLLAGQSFTFALSAAIAVLVISCPCALGLATPTAIMVGTGKGAENGILIKSAEALEAARDVQTVILDKTGTVTEGKPRVTDIIASEGTSREELLKMAASAEKASEHPLSQAIVQEALKEGVNLLPNSDFKAYAGEGISVKVNMEKVLAGNARLMQSYHISLGEAENTAAALARDGKTPLFFAARGKLLGIVALADTVKETSKRAVAALEAMGLNVVMVTGDNRRTAATVGRVLGVEQVVAEVLPAEKADEVIRLQQQGQKVAMIGDGINDAPALARADVGIAIGAGTDVAVESAEIVLVKNDLLAAVTALQLSRATVRNIKQNLFWAFIYNIIGIPLAAGVFYYALGWKLNPMFAAAAMSLSSVCVVSNALRLRWFKPNFKLTRAVRKKESFVIKKLTIEGMSCGHCSARVETALSALPGVSATVDLSAKTATVTLAQPVADEALREAVQSAGYTVTEIK